MIKKSWAVLSAFCLFVFSGAQTLTVDEAIIESMSYFSARLTAGTKVVVLNIESESKNLSDYIIGESDAFIMNSTKLSLVDKSKLPIIMQEKNINDLNKIDENTALEIGKKLGASCVIFGSVSKLGANYRFRAQALSTANGQIFGMQSLNVGEDEILADLLGMEFSSSKAASQTPQTKRDAEFDDLQNRRSGVGFGDSQSARERLESEMGGSNFSNSQSANNSNQNVQVVIVRDTIYRDAPTAAALPVDPYIRQYYGDGQTASATAVRAANSAQKRSRFFIAQRWQVSASASLPTYDGTEFEIGGLKRDKLLFTGITNFITSNDGGGGGGGIFIAPVISAGEVFMFAPGMDLGFWAYSGGSFELFWGGPSIRIMVGYRFVFFDINTKWHFGYADSYDYSYYNYYDSYDNGFDYGFKVRFSFGVGVSFIIGRRN